MELQYLFFCLALLASAASFSIPERFPEQGNASLQELAYSHSRCKCSDGKCVTDNRGNVKCVCKPGYALQDEFTCKPCDCGKKGQCIFTLSPKSRGDFKYEKKCVCDVGSAEKDGKCIDCYCGENSACEFDGEEKNCYCIEGYSEKDGKCTKCDCGFYGTCEFKKGIKQCTCDEGSLELNGICEECDCGEHGTCTFRDGTKYCQCKDMFKDNEGTCEECNCGENSVECSFSGGKKVCRCNKGFSEKNGLCEVCDCGLNSFGCTFYENQKNCACQPGYVQKGHTCVVACSIDRPCKNGGTCIYGHCSCLPGTRGEFCEIIDGCEYLCPQQPDVTCSYDVNRQKPYCECLGSDLSFDEEKKKCQKTCVDDNSCHNGAICEINRGGRFCKCLKGTQGHFCEIIDGCDQLKCEDGQAKCIYDKIENTAKCSCNIDTLKFDYETGICRETCNEDNSCKNEAICESNRGGKFCKCLIGTEGDFCETIDGCDQLNCEDGQAKCLYDSQEQKAKCYCNSDTLKFDYETGICRETCNDYDSCKNGATCVSNRGDQFCKCLPGTQGHFCETIDGCDQLKCEDGQAKCIYDTQEQKAKCSCDMNTLKFDYDTGICRETCIGDNSCENGATCESNRGGQFCKCLPGTQGHFCEIIVGCEELKCEYGQAKCIYDTQEKTAKCSCDIDTLNFDYETGICRETCIGYNSCENGATCESNRGGQFCKCLPGTQGHFCEIIVGCEELKCEYGQAKCIYDRQEKKAKCSCDIITLNFDYEIGICRETCIDDDSCKNGATCVSNRGGKFCKCLPGTQGHFCETIDGCDQLNCEDGQAECIYDKKEKTAKCACHIDTLKFDYETGICSETCKNDDSCHNGATCESKRGGKFCKCLAGTQGHFCEIIVGCDQLKCEDGQAKCIYDKKEKTAKCSCLIDTLKFDYETGICRRGCTTDYDCKNGGRCRRNGYSAFCDCITGTKGDLCEVVKDCEEGRIRCEGNAYCVFDQNRLEGVCACDDVKKRYDVLEKECRETCTEDASCHNGGLCVHRGDHLFCECNVGTGGHQCENVVECQRGLCGHSGDVDCIYDVKKMAAVCQCKNREQIFDPATKTCKACDCGKNSISCRYKDGKIDCVCREGYEVKKGKCQKTKCTEKRCQNGKCQVIDDKEVCSCYEGYQLDGDYCRKLNCSKTPCYNGTCVVRYGNREECICQDGYSLKDGFCIRGACKVTTCYGGRCDIIDGELMCVCPKNFSLQGKGCYETVCKKRHCFGGSCAVNKKKEEICTCLEGYVLVNDVCKKILCKKPCYGGQCKFIDGKEECICPPGFSIFEDVCRENKARRWSAYKK